MKSSLSTMTFIIMTFKLKAYKTTFFANECLNLFEKEKKENILRKSPLDHEVESMLW